MRIAHGITPLAEHVIGTCEDAPLLACVQVLPEGPPVDLRRRAERSLQAQLGAPAAQVNLRPDRERAKLYSCWFKLLLLSTCFCGNLCRSTIWRLGLKLTGPGSGWSMALLAGCIRLNRQTCPAATWQTDLALVPCMVPC